MGNHARAKTLKIKALQDAANELGIELATIRAVDEVESRGAGFLDDGHVKILFERHKFHQFTKGKYDASHPGISNRNPGGYGKAGLNQNHRFSEAFQLDPIAAMKSASWGRYQIMGFNYEAAGFNDVGSFVDAMKISEDEHLKAFVKLIKAWGLASELRQHQWASFARQYNGVDYKKNRYDEKLAAAYQKFKTESVELVTEPVTEPPTPQIHVEHAEEVKAEAPKPVEGGAKDDPPAQASQGGRKSTIATIVGSVVGVLSAVGGWLQNNGSTAIVGIVCATVVILVWMFRQVFIDYMRIKVISDPSKINAK